MIVENKGISLVAVTIVMLLVATLAFVVASMMAGGNIASITYMQSQQAFYVAEAGLKHVLFKLKTDVNYKANPTTVTNNFGNGSFSVTVTKNGKTYTLTSTGTVATAVRKIEQIVRVEAGGGVSGYPGGVPQAFNYSMHSFGNHTDFKNSTGTLNGDVAATVTVQSYSEMTINGTVTDNSSVNDPSPVDLDGYRSIADHIESTGFVFQEGQTYGAVGSEEVYFIDGNTTIEDNVTIYGSVIATGNIFVRSTGVTIDAASGYPSLITGNNIHGKGLTNSTIIGLIFADNNVDFDNLSGVTINGTILSDNNTEVKSGSNFTINYDPDISDNPPPYFEGFSPQFTITSQSWREIY